MGSAHPISVLLGSVASYLGYFMLTCAHSNDSSHSIRSSSRRRHHRFKKQKKQRKKQRKKQEKQKKKQKKQDTDE